MNCREVSQPLGVSWAFAPLVRDFPAMRGAQRAALSGRGLVRAAGVARRHGVPRGRARLRCTTTGSGRTPSSGSGPGSGASGPRWWAGHRSGVVRPGCLRGARSPGADPAERRRPPCPGPPRPGPPRPSPRRSRSRRPCSRSSPSPSPSPSWRRPSPAHSRSSSPWPPRPPPTCCRPAWSWRPRGLPRVTVGRRRGTGLLRRALGAQFGEAQAAGREGEARGGQEGLAAPAPVCGATALPAAGAAAASAAGRVRTVVVRVTVPAGGTVRGGERPPVLPARFGRSSAPRAGEGSVEVPAARVAVVHEAWRLGRFPGAAEATAVKVVCGMNDSGRGGVVSGRRHDSRHDAELLG